MQGKSKSPVFLVGCPRSGTTLLQSLLAAHPQIASFPESKFFQYLVPLYEPRRRALGMISRAARPRLIEFFQEELGRPDLLSGLPKLPFQGLYTRKFIKNLNILTAEQGKSIWLEKTPQHVYYIEYIEKLVPQSKIIHIIRNGSDVVASLYEASRQAPKAWDGEWSLDQCIDWWERAVEISLRHLHQPNHIVIRYEALVKEPERLLRQICDFIGVEFYETMLQDYRQAAKKVMLPHESWKSSASQDIQNANNKKFYKLFDDRQKQYIIERLSKVNLDQYNVKR